MLMSEIERGLAGDSMIGRDWATRARSRHPTTPCGPAKPACGRQNDWSARPAAPAAPSSSAELAERGGRTRDPGRPPEAASRPTTADRRRRRAALPGHRLRAQPAPSRRASTRAPRTIARGTFSPCAPRMVSEPKPRGPGRSWPGWPRTTPWRRTTKRSERDRESWSGGFCAGCSSSAGGAALRGHRAASCSCSDPDVQGRRERARATAQPPSQFVTPDTALGRQPFIPRPGPAQRTDTSCCCTAQTHRCTPGNPGSPRSATVPHDQH
jgi:hypothetical protein